MLTSHRKLGGQITRETDNQAQLRLYLNVSNVCATDHTHSYRLSVQHAL